MRDKYAKVSSLDPNELAAYLVLSKALQEPIRKLIYNATGETAVEKYLAKIDEAEDFYAGFDLRRRKF